ncbi:MAG TPA: DUF4169 family protein [Polyangiaceae bacterium]|jgi:hypothetical protein|nr:DUF4169 family protein [Polyangiaceae bacterium]
MGNVVNLNKFRKRKMERERLKSADTNRRLHGRTKAERARDEAEKRKLEKGLDGAMLVKDPGEHEVE